MLVELKATKRSATGKGVKSMRDQGQMPAILYGPKQESVAVEISQRDFSKTFELAGESTVINLSVDGDAHHVLIHEIDRDPITGNPRHVDFYAIVKGQKVKVDVALVFTGEAPAVKELSATVVKALHELEVEADPMNLPKELVVDLSGMKELNMQILAKDIVLPEGVVLVTDGDEVVVKVLEAKEEKIEDVVAPDLSAIEISEERGKKPTDEATEGKSEGGKDSEKA